MPAVFIRSFNIFPLSFFLFTHIHLSIIDFILFQKIWYFNQSPVLHTRFFNCTFPAQFDILLIEENQLSLAPAAGSLTFHLLQLTHLTAASLVLHNNEQHVLTEHHLGSSSVQLQLFAISHPPNPPLSSG